MAHFAILNENNIVINVLAVNDNILEDADGNEIEQKGINHLKKVLNDVNLKAVQCSKWTRNGKRVEMNLHKAPFRNNYPSLGSTWDPATENFILPQPYPSWILDDTQNWVPPIIKPTEAQCYYGNEISPSEAQQGDYITVNNILILPDRINPIWNETEQRWQGMHNDGNIRVWNPNTSSWYPSL